MALKDQIQNSEMYIFFSQIDIIVRILFKWIFNKLQQ